MTKKENRDDLRKYFLLSPSHIDKKIRDFRFDGHINKLNDAVLKLILLGFQKYKELLKEKGIDETRKVLEEIKI